MKNVFQVGRHMLSVFGSDGRWVVAVDGVLLRGWHASQAEAWSAGVAEAERIDRLSREPDASAGPAPLLGG